MKGNLQLLPKRRARIIAAETRRGRVIEGEAPVDQSSSPIVILRELPDTAHHHIERVELVERLVLEFEPFKEACRERGIDSADVRCDCWCVGWFDSCRRSIAAPRNAHPVPQPRRQASGQPLHAAARGLRLPARPLVDPLP